MRVSGGTCSQEEDSVPAMTEPTEEFAHTERNTLGRTDAYEL